MECRKWSKNRLGIDPIAGMNTSYLLYEDMSGYLADYGITNLAQAQNLDGDPRGFNCWYSTSDLDLGGDWVDQWSDFVKGLSHGGIRIGNQDDSLI